MGTTNYQELKKYKVKLPAIASTAIIFLILGGFGALSIFYEPPSSETVVIVEESNESAQTMISRLDLKEQSAMAKSTQGIERLTVLLTWVGFGTLIVSLIGTIAIYKTLEESRNANALNRELSRIELTAYLISMNHRILISSGGEVKVNFGIENIGKTAAKDTRLVAKLFINNNRSKSLDLVRRNGSIPSGLMSGVNWEISSQNIQWVSEKLNISHIVIEIFLSYKNIFGSNIYEAERYVCHHSDMMRDRESELEKLELIIRLKK